MEPVALPFESYYEAPLPVLNEPHRRFVMAVVVVLRRWTALGLAIENSWADQPQLKGNRLCKDLLQGFNGQPIDIDKLEDFLDEFMLTHFNTEVADGSCREVARSLGSLYGFCLQGNTSLADELITKYQQSAGSALHSSVNERPQDIEVDSDGEDEDGAGPYRGLSAQYNAPAAPVTIPTALDAPAPQPARPAPPPAVDEDGWTTVRRGSRR